jgi:hypothetical protein
MGVSNSLALIFEFSVYLQWICSGSTEDLGKVECQLWMMGDNCLAHTFLVYLTYTKDVYKKGKKSNLKSPMEVTSSKGE